MTNRINGSVRFSTIQNDSNGGFVIAFYEKAEDVGHIEKATGMIEFTDWRTLRAFVALQSQLVARLDGAITRELAKNN